MSSEQDPSVPSPSSPGQTRRMQTPSPIGLRHRPSVRSATFNVKDDGLRRASFFSDGLSETHRSFRASTDDLLLPRAKTTSPIDDQIETSHWHSVPLGLALLPAVGGLFFKDGSAVVTDITLLGLAAIFLNWALRLPWEWYKAAQATMTLEPDMQSSFANLDEEDEDNLEGTNDSGVAETTGDLPRARARAYVENSDDDEILAAQQELRLHELLALLSCFMFPLLGAWLLHAIRSQLSRPSEGLVSNYNLTIFILVAEIRPLSHLIKLIQRRTMFLQRKVNTRILEQEQIEEKQDVMAMSKRLEELEAHVAEAANSAIQNPQASVSQDVLISRAAAQASTDLRKAFQPELDALNRAMRRYEKRMTITAIQVESRLQDLETRLKDVVVLAAAAQRSADSHPRNYFLVLINWVSAAVVVPARYAFRAISLPGRLAQRVLDWVKSMLKLSRKVDARNGRAVPRSTASRPKSIQKKGKAAV